MKIFSLLLFFCLQLTNIYSLTFSVLSQGQFNTAISTIQNYANRQYIDELIFEGYSPTQTDITNISGISIVRQCTNLKTFRFVLAGTIIPVNSFEQVIQSVEDLQNITYLHLYFYVTGQNQLSGLSRLMSKNKKLEYLYITAASNGLSNICNALQNVHLQLNLNYFYMDIGWNQVSDISCLGPMFTNLIQLEQLYIHVFKNQISNISFLQNSFDTLQKLQTLSIIMYSNQISQFYMQNSIAKLSSLKTLSFEFGPDITTNRIWSNFTVVHPTLERIRYNVKSYLSTSTELFRYLPKLKAVELIFRYEYRYSDLLHVMNQMGDLQDLELFWIYPYAIPNESVQDLSIISCYSLKPMNMQHMANVLTDTILPNLERIHIERNWCHPSHGYVVPAFSHSKVQEVLYNINYYAQFRNYFGHHNNMFNNLPSLKRVYIQYINMQLSNAQFSGYDSIFTSLAGKNLDKLSVNFIINTLNSFSYIGNTKGQINAKEAEFHINNNQYTNMNGLQNFVESIINPNVCKSILVSGHTNQITDVSQIKNALGNFVNLENISLYYYNNKIFDGNQFIGVYDNKPNLKSVTLELRNNSLEDQRSFNQVFLPVSYYGKSKMESYRIDLQSPAKTTDVETFQNMQEKGEYLAITKFAYCISDWQMAKRFMMGTNVCIDCISTHCHSCTKSDQCDVCRISVPARELPLCDCIMGYYDGSDHTCLKCSKKCESCNNGQDCLTCVNSIPKRIVPDCICPQGYYDDGIQDQCQECRLGCFDCNDGMSCISCIDGYYQKGNQCLLCPQHFSKCTYNQQTQIVEATQCKGQNRYYILPECPCVEGYYPIINQENCLPCNIKCTACTSFKKCQSCIVGYYHDSQNDSCNKCNPLCKTCSKGTTCDSCYDRQLDPSTACSKKYVSGGSNSDNSIIYNGDSNYNNKGDNNEDENTGNDNGGESSENNGNGGDGNENNYNGISDEEVYKNPFKQSDTFNFKANFFFFNTITKETTEQKCHMKCAACQEKYDLCTECYPGLNRINNPPFCSCIHGYTNLGNTSDDCYKCHNYCESCGTNINQCLSCRDSDLRKLNQVNQTCDCFKGYKSSKNINETKCISCYKYLGECLFDCPQNTIKDQKSKQCIEITFQITNSHNLIIVLCSIFLILIILLGKIFLNHFTFGPKIYVKKKNSSISEINQSQNLSRQRIIQSESFSKFNQENENQI